MGTAESGCLIPEVCRRPTSVFLHGINRPLLNWVMYAILHRSDPRFIWTDVRFEHEALDPQDPLSTRVVPPEQLSVVAPGVLRRTAGPGQPRPSLIHPGEHPDEVRRLVEFLTLPEHTQRLISHVDGQDRVPVLGLSNAHRLAAIFPTEVVAPTLRGILGAGVSLVMTWADSVPGGSSAFDFVLGVEGSEPLAWREAVLRCTLGISEGLVRAGRFYRLGDLAPITEELGQVTIPKP